MKINHRDNNDLSSAIENYKTNEAILDQKASLLEGFKEINNLEYSIGREYNKNFIPWDNGSISVLSLKKDYEEKEIIGDYILLPGIREKGNINIKIVLKEEYNGKKVYLAKKIY